MNRVRSLRYHADRPPSVEAVQSKISRIILRHEQLKVAFQQLHSEIRTGLIEAEDVFASLAVPLMKLVGLKTVEMAAQGRLSTIVTSIDLSRPQEENYMSRAIMAGNELMERQKLQLMQLINLLKKIEAQVNSSQNSIFQNLADHQAFIKKFFVKAFRYVTAIHQSSQSNDLSHIMLKILKATFDQVGIALGSVEVGIDDLICELAEKMCNPMVEYVNGLKAEMKMGTCSRLLDVVKEMDGAMKVKKFELEEARKLARLAEQSRIETLSKLKKSEETTMKRTISLGLLIEDTTEREENKKVESEENLTKEKKESDETSTKNKFLGMKEDQAKDDNLLWKLLRKKRKCLVPDSPLGPKELLGIGTCNKKLNSSRASPSLTRRPVTRSQSKRSDLQSSFINSRMLLGSSPSAMTEKVLRCRRRTP